MPYYYFNRCPKRALPKIEALTAELGLREIECYPPIREWSGEPFRRRKKFDRELLVIYDPNQKSPLTLQTAEPVTHRQKDVKQVIKRFIKIAQPTEISNLFNNYDLKEFEA